MKNGAIIAGIGLGISIILNIINTTVGVHPFIQIPILILSMVMAIVGLIKMIKARNNKG